MNRIWKILALGFLWISATFVQGADNPRTLYVANSLGRTISALDLATGVMSQNVLQIGQMPSQIVANGTKLLVLNSSPAELMIIDGRALQVSGQIALPEGSNPYQMALSGGSRLYITLLLANSVAVVDLARQEVVKLVPVGVAPQGIIIAGNCAWVANTGGYPDYAGSSLSCIDLETDAVVTEIPLPANPQVVRQGPDNRLYALCSGAWGANAGKVAVIDLQRLPSPAVVDTLAIGGYPGDLVITPDGTALMCDWGDAANGFLYRFNIQSGIISADASRPLRVGRGAMRLYRDDPSGDLYLCAFDQDAIEKIDSATGAVLAAWPAGDGPNDMVILEAISEGDEGAAPAMAGYPNPFNQGTSIHFTLARELPAKLRIYALGGRLVVKKELGVLAGGQQDVYWDGMDASGLPAGSGIYWGVVEIGGVRRSCKMTLLRR